MGQISWPRWIALRPQIPLRTTLKGRPSFSDLAIDQLGLVWLQALTHQEIGNISAKARKFPGSKPVSRTLGRYHWWLEMEQNEIAGVPSWAAVRAIWPTNASCSEHVLK